MSPGGRVRRPLVSANESERGSKRKKKRKETLDASSASALAALVLSEGEGERSSPQKKKKTKHRETMDAREALVLTAEIGAEAAAKEERRATLDRASLAELRERAGDSEELTLRGDDLKAFMDDVASPKALVVASEKKKAPRRRTATDAYDALFGATRRSEKTTTATTGFEFASAATHLPLSPEKQDSGQKKLPRSCLKRQRNTEAFKEAGESGVRFVLERSEVRTFDQNDPSTALTPLGEKMLPLKSQSARKATLADRPSSPARRATVANSQTLARWKTRFDPDDRPLDDINRSIRRQSGVFPDNDQDHQDERPSDEDDENQREDDGDEAPLQTDDDDQEEDEEEVPCGDEKKLTPIEEIEGEMEEAQTPGLEDQTVQLEADLGAFLLKTGKSSSSSKGSLPAWDEDDDQNDTREHTVQLEADLLRVLSSTNSSSSSSSKRGERDNEPRKEEEEPPSEEEEPSQEEEVSPPSSSSSVKVESKAEQYFRQLKIDDASLRKTLGDDDDDDDDDAKSLLKMEVPSHCRAVWSRVMTVAAMEEKQRSEAERHRLEAENAAEVMEAFSEEGKMEIFSEDFLREAAKDIKEEVENRLKREVVARIESEAAAVVSRAADVEERARGWRRLDEEANRLETAADQLQTQAVESLRARCADLEERVVRARQRRDDLLSRIAAKDRDLESQDTPPPETDLSLSLPPNDDDDDDDLDAQKNSVTAAALAAARRRSQQQQQQGKSLFSSENGSLRRLQLAEGLQSWRLSSVSPSELVLDLPNAFFGSQGAIHVGLGADARPRILFHRHVAKKKQEAASSLLALRCLRESPPSWLHPEAKRQGGKNSAVVEILLANRDEAPAALERLSWFAAKLATLAKELYHVKLRYPSATMAWLSSEDHDSAKLTVRCVSHSAPASVDLAFHIRRGYPDPGSRATASVALLEDDRSPGRRKNDQDHLLRLGLEAAQGTKAPEALAAALSLLRERGFLVETTSDGLQAAKMPLPGTILAMAACVSEALNNMKEVSS